MHKREQIMQAVSADLTGLSSTGDNVSRIRTVSIIDAKSLTIEQGSDQLTKKIGGTASRDLSFNVVIAVKDNGNIETILNQIAAEVYKTLKSQSANTLALGFVDSVNLTNESQPQIEGDSETPTGQARMTWQVVYKHSLIDTEV